ncbi:hypothetical protein [Achromobacter sp. AGC39]
MTTSPAPGLRGSGKINGVFFNAAGDVAAVASTFALLAHPRARAAYGGRTLRYRVALYRRDSLVPFAAFDDLHYPVNDVAFHPTGTTVAIGGGSYDGGYLFEGELIVWDWRETHGVHLYNQVPEVVRCHYNAAGDQIEAWVRPWDDGDDARDAFDALFRVQAPAPCPGSQALNVNVDAAPSVPAELRAQALRAPDVQQLEARLQAWFGVAGWTRRGAILDVAWLDRDRYAAVHEGCQLEVHHRNGDRLATHSGAGHGVEILTSGKDVLVHVVQTGQAGQIVGRQDARLYTYTGAGADASAHTHTTTNAGLQLTRAYDGEFTFSATPQGRILGRQNRVTAAPGQARDVLLDLATGVEHRPDLGHYDCFNHYLRIRHAPCLFLLQGTPASSHERKTLCVVQPDGPVRRLWPVLKTSNDAASHAMELCGAYVDDALGPGLVIGGKHYSPNVRAPYSGFIYRKPLGRDRELWRRPIPASPSAIVHMPALNLIAAAFLDGSLQLIDAQTGVLRRYARVRVDGLPTLIFAMDADAQSLVVGTVDGTIKVLEAGQLGGAPADAPEERRQASDRAGSDRGADREANGYAPDTSSVIDLD